MTIVFVAALPWVLFAVAYAVYRAVRSLYSGLVHRQHARFCPWNAWFDSRTRNHDSVRKEE